MRYCCIGKHAALSSKWSPTQGNVSFFSISYDRTAVKPAVQLLQIQKVHLVAYMQFLPFFIYFSYLFYLGHLSFLGLQTNTRRQSNSSTFWTSKSYNMETFMSSTASAFVHATRKRYQKVPRAKSGTFWFPWMDPVDGFQWFNPNSIALVLLFNMRLERSFSIGIMSAIPLIALIIPKANIGRSLSSYGERRKNSLLCFCCLDSFANSAGRKSTPESTWD